MARIRSIKPSFFINEDLGALSAFHRLGFIGLWVHADREGRLEDRPRRLKMAIFPYDDDMPVSFEQLITDLEDKGFLQRYEVDGRPLLMIPNFARHQLIAREEPASELPGPDGVITPYERPPNETVRARIYQRDNFTCVYCQRQMSKMVRMRCVDHVIPYARGGSHRDDNLVTACKPCNAKKGCKTPSESEMPWPEGFGSYLTGGQLPVNGSRQVLDLGNGSRKQEKEQKSVSSPAPMAPDEPAVLTFDVVGKGGPAWNLTQSQIDEWSELYPGLNVLGECRKALAWVNADKGRRKTSSGMARFLVGWFMRAVNSGAARTTTTRGPVSVHRASQCSIDAGPTARDLEFIAQWERANGKAASS